MAYEDDLNKAIGIRLQLVRRAKNVTQGQLAQKLSRIGMSLAQQTIAKIENGTRPMKLAEAEAIATILGIDVSALIPNEDRTEDLFELTEGMGLFFNRLNAIALAIRDAKASQTNALKLWSAASDDVRRAFLAERDVDEKTVIRWLTESVAEAASLLVPMGEFVELKTSDTEA